MWKEIKQDEFAKIDVFAQFIKGRAEHYGKSYSAEKAKSFIDGFGASLYWYDDGIFLIALSLYVLPDRSKVKIANCLVKQKRDGEGDEKDCVKIAVRKVREYMDAKGMRYAYALTPNTPFNPFQDKFHEAIDIMYWEHSKTLETEYNVWRREIDRDPKRKEEDELWVNNGAA